MKLRFFRRIAAFALSLTLLAGSLFLSSRRASAENTPASVPARTTSDRTELTIDDTQYPVIILPGINHSVAYLADEEGNPVTNKNGEKFENGLLIVDTDMLVRNVLGKLLGPLLLSIVFRSDVKLSDGIKATLGNLFRVQMSDYDGNPVNNLVVKKYDYPVSEMDADTKDWFYRMLPVSSYSELVGEDMLYLYTFPLVGDPMESARGLVDYIEMVKRQKGVDKVNLLSVSLGGTILTAYSDVVNGDFSSINRICGVVSVYDGTTIIDDFFARRFDLDDEFFYGEWFPAVMKEGLGLNDFLAYTLSSVIALLPQKVRDTILTAAMDSFLDYLMVNDPQFWAMMSSEAYPELAARYISDDEHRVLKAKTDAFQQARLNLKENLTVAHEEFGVDVFTISGYNLSYTDGVYNFFGAVESHKTVNGDAIIPVGSTSLGASSVPKGSCFDDEYIARADADKLSPDLSVDASTCLFPDTAFFYCDQHHEIGHNDSALKLAAYIVAGAIDDVNTAPDRFPQFNRSRDSRDLTRWLLSDAELVINNADGAYSEDQIALVRSAVDAANAMLEDTICDPELCDKATSDLTDALVQVGARQPKSEDGKLTLFLADAAQKIYTRICKLKGYVD